MKKPVREYGWNEGLSVPHRVPLRVEVRMGSLELERAFAVGKREDGTRHICVRRGRHGVGEGGLLP